MEKETDISLLMRYKLIPFAEGLVKTCEGKLKDSLSELVRPDKRPNVNECANFQD